MYFYELSSKLTIDRISSFLAKFGFGVTTGIELLSETEYFAYEELETW